MDGTCRTRASRPRRITAGTLTLALALIAATASAQSTAPATAPTLAQSVATFIAQPQFQRADWGIAVRSLDTGKPVLEHHAERLFIPASTAKLFTAALALATLGSDTRIATTLYATSTRIDKAGTLRGDLILYGRGDPSLGMPGVTAGWADDFAAALAKLGVKRVRGNLIADATYFTGPTIGVGWEANDLQTWYGAAPSALSVQGNLIAVDVARDGRRCCTVAVTPQAAGVDVANSMSADATDPVSLYRAPGSSTLYATGHLPTRTRKHAYRLSMPDPPRAAATLLREALARRGIRLDGSVRVLRWPQSDPALAATGTHAIAQVQSPSIAQLVDYTLKNSDNLYAQLLWLQVGTAAAQRGDCANGHPDTSTAWALCALRGLLEQAGIAPSAVLLAEGSGLARKNLVTPDAFVQWLAWVNRQPWGANLRDALPVAGVDGTLQYRFRDGPATDNLQAKTGTLSHAYTLAGFVTNRAGAHLVFTVMLNRYPRWEVAREYPDAPSPQHALDAVARLIATSGAR